MAKRRPQKPKRRTKRRKPTRVEIDITELEKIVERASASLTDDDREKLTAALDTLAWVTRELEAKRVSVQRLKKLLFGAKTEKTSQVVGEPGEGSEDGDVA